MRKSTNKFEVVIDKRVLLLLLRLRSEKEKGLDKTSEK